jgi:uncharacterized membrane protein
MNRILAILTLIFISGSVHAAGWNDYSLDIGDGYMVFRANSMDVSIGQTGGSLILYPQDYAGVGPVIAYDMKDNFILTKNAGSVPRNLFEGDTFENIDQGREWYFVIPKATNEPLGPYTKEAFMNVLREKTIQNVDWVEPRNPNFWTPVLGSLIFIAIAIPILAIKFFYVSIPLITLMAWGIIRLLKKRKQKKSLEATA